MFILKLSIIQSLSAYFSDEEACGIAKDALEYGFSSYEVLQADLKQIIRDSETFQNTKHPKQIAKQCIKDIMHRNVDKMSMIKGRRLSLHME